MSNRKTGRDANQSVNALVKLGGLNQTTVERHQLGSARRHVTHGCHGKMIPAQDVFIRGGIGIKSIAKLILTRSQRNPRTQNIFSPPFCAAGTTSAAYKTLFRRDEECTA